MTPSTRDTRRGHWLVIVGRQHDDLFEELQKLFAHTNTVEVMRDRRRSELHGVSQPVAGKGQRIRTRAHYITHNAIADPSVVERLLILGSELQTTEQKVDHPNCLPFSSSCSA